MKTYWLLAVAAALVVHCAAQETKVIAAGQMPAITTDAQQHLHLVYGRADSIFYTFSTGKGVSFSSPQLVGVVQHLVASATRGPQITATAAGMAIVASNNDGTIFSFTNEGNNGWKKTGVVNDADTSNKEGFLALGSDGRQNLFAVWLDVRNNGKNKVYGARSADGGRSWQKNITIYSSPSGTVCECCKPSVAVDGNNVFVMFRNSLDGNRNLYLAHSSNGGKTFAAARKLGEGNWPLRACPMDGGGIAIGSNGKVQTVWRRADTVYTCEPGKKEQALGEGKYCTLASANKGFVYAWSSNGQITCLLPNGKTELLGKGRQPQLTTLDNNQVICVWENNKMIESATLSL